MRNKKRLLLGYRNKKVGLVRYKRNWLGVGLIGLGIVTFPLPTGSPFIIALGMALNTPISLKHQIRNKLEDIRFKMGVMF